MYNELFIDRNGIEWMQLNFCIWTATCKIELIHHCQSSLAPRRRTTCNRLKGCFLLWNGITLPKTNKSPLKVDGWKTR